VAALLPSVDEGLADHRHHLLAWRRAWPSTATSPRPSPSGCATACCTSPVGSRSPAAARNSTSSTPGRGRPSCSQPSRSSKRSPPPAADRRHRPTHHPAGPSRPQPRSRLPAHRPHKRRGCAEPLARPPSRPTTTRSPPRTAAGGLLGHSPALTARSGLVALHRVVLNAQF